MGSVSKEEILSVVQKYWGFSELRPNQEEAIRFALEKKDSLVILPTGGGKSLCYQAPALMRDGTTIVVSPLISLMKDQVDSLVQIGIKAFQLDSSLSLGDKRFIEKELISGNIPILYVSPERLFQIDFLEILSQIKLTSLIIDEAHCISQWGHDFRTEYRKLGQWKSRFPKTSIHAFTATATPRVREDIVKQLNLNEPEILIGDFYRSNLKYKVYPKNNVSHQILEFVKAHRTDSGIIYCIRRKDVESLSEFLKANQVPCLPYHAGMSNGERKKVQEDFSKDNCNLIVATVAFGMGIDKSNIRYVLHAGLPKSIEHYSQESGRAGRDGLDSECILYFSIGDSITWKSILQKSAEELKLSPEFVVSQNRHLEEMANFGRSRVCRHKYLVTYFGQRWELENCGACDVCTEKRNFHPDSENISRKILSAVYRLDNRFGIGHVIAVLRGENLAKIREFHHDQLSVYGLLREHSKEQLKDWIYELLGQGALDQEGFPYPILKLNAKSNQVLKKEIHIPLPLPVDNAKEKRSPEYHPMEEKLFEELRRYRKIKADSQSIAPFQVFSDQTLRELSQTRPSSLPQMRLVHGVGDKKLQDYGEQILKILKDFCKENELSMDQNYRSQAAPKKPSAVTGTKKEAFEMFDSGANITEVIQKTERAKSTVIEYLCDYLITQNITDITRYVSSQIEAEVTQAIQEVGIERLKPIYQFLNEKISYDDIRIVCSKWKAMENLSKENN